MGRSPGSKNLPVEQIAAIKVRVLELCADLTPVQDMVNEFGITKAAYYGILARDEDFKRRVESMQYAASIDLVDSIRTIPANDKYDVPRARVMIDGIRASLELRWPERYGKRMQVTVKTVDMSGALQRARARVDAARTIDGECTTVAAVASVLSNERWSLESGADTLDSGADDIDELL